MIWNCCPLRRYSSHCTFKHYYKKMIQRKHWKNLKFQSLICFCDEKIYLQHTYFGYLCSTYTIMLPSPILRGSYASQNMRFLISNMQRFFWVISQFLKGNVPFVPNWYIMLLKLYIRTLISLLWIGFMNLI